MACAGHKGDCIKIKFGGVDVARENESAHKRARKLVEACWFAEEMSYLIFPIIFIAKHLHVCRPTRITLLEGVQIAWRAECIL